MKLKSNKTSFHDGRCAVCSCNQVNTHSHGNVLKHLQTRQCMNKILLEKTNIDNKEVLIETKLLGMKLFCPASKMQETRNSNCDSNKMNYRNSKIYECSMLYVCLFNLSIFILHLCINCVC